MKLAKRLEQISPSKTLSITNRVLEMKQNGEDVISLGAGQPDFDTPDHIKQAAIDAIHKGHTKYTNSTGIPELKEAISQKMKRDNGLDFGHDEIIVTCGGKYALASAILAICNKGDEVLIPAPYWVSYPEMVRIAGATPVFVPTKAEEGFSLDIDALQSATTSRTKMMLFNNPTNPSGAVYSTESTDELVEWVKTTDILVMTDEIYEVITFDDVPIRSVASYPKMQDRVITVNGVSKTYAMTGWRIGYAAGPKQFISQMGKIQSHMTSNPTSISQYAAVAALNGDQSFVDMMVSAFKERRDYLCKQLNGVEGITCPEGKGAFYLFPDVSNFYGKSIGNTKIENSVSFCQYLLEEKKVALIPGDAFGAPNHVRISFATSLEQLKEAMERMEQGLKDLK